MGGALHISVIAIVELTTQLAAAWLLLTLTVIRPSLVSGKQTLLVSGVPLPTPAPVTLSRSIASVLSSHWVKH
jgi:hypothetical protein